MDCKLSVVVPVYNVEKYIGIMIESLQNQTYKNLEIILVDDGSPDCSGAICDEYAEKDERIRVIHKKNAGVGAARNDGLDTATGKWIIFCDSDDWVECDALEKLLAKGEETGADIVFGDVNLVYGNQVQSVRFYKDEFVSSDRKLIDKLIAANFCKTYCYNPPADGPAFGYGGPWNKIVRRKILIDNKIRFDTRVKGIFDDIIYTAYIFAAAKIIAYVHVPVYNYRQIGTSITRTYKANLLEINNVIFHSWEEFLDKYGKKGQFTEPYYANVIRRLTTTLGLYFFNKNNTMGLKEQIKKLGKLTQSEPYTTAIRLADFKKLNNRFDRLLVKAAMHNSPWRMYCIYRISVLKNKVLKKKIR